jgi:hypothetical protein
MSSLFGNTPIPSVGISKAEAILAAKRAAGPWLNAWHDPIASVKAFTNCVRLADLNADGDYKLLIADADKKLKVYKGTSLNSEHALLDVPSALAVFYTDLNQPQTPSIAVAAGSYIFIYRNLRPYYKFTLPAMDLDQKEQDVWANLRLNKLETHAAMSALTELNDSGVTLSARSLNLIALNDVKDQESFIQAHKHLPLVQLVCYLIYACVLSRSFIVFIVYFLLVPIDEFIRSLVMIAMIVRSLKCTDGDNMYGHIK